MRFLLILIAAAIAQTTPSIAEPAGKRSCRIVFPERPKDAPAAVYLFDGKGSREVTLPSMNFSEVIDLPGGELTLLMTRDKITDPENLPPSAPSLKIAENIRDFYILVSADPSNPTLPLRLELVDTGDGTLKPGETLWINHTDHRISAKLGEGEMTVDPQSQTVSKSPVSISGYYKAEFSYQPDAQGETRRITEQQWWHDVESRHVGFIVDTQGILPGVYFYRDFR